MAERKSLLILRLEGLLQSWGECSKWDFRDSSTMPTKSGIVGLLGCAMGLERGSNDLVDLAQNISVAVRADRPGVKMIDFQTVTGNPMMNAAGKPRANGFTIITPRVYLQDACFSVFVETSEEWCQKIMAALKDPVWNIYLGRKSCVPSRPVFETVSDSYTSLMDALKTHPLADRAEFPVTYECEMPYQTGASLFRPDDLIGQDREFALRKVWRGVIQEE